MSARRPGARMDARPSHVMVRASRALTQIYDGELRGVGLKTSQFTILQILATVGSITQGRLGRILMLDGAPLSSTLRSLLSRKWVRIRTDRNRRNREVALTPAGRTKLECARPAWRRAQDRIAIQIGRERLDALMAELTAIVELTGHL
jgi:DNA-binding MarR family transcriptional regulator